MTRLDPIQNLPTLTLRNAPPGARPTESAPSEPQDRLSLGEPAAEAPAELPQGTWKRALLAALSLVPILGAVGCAAAGTAPDPRPTPPVSVVVDQPTTPAPTAQEATPTTPSTPAVKPARVGVLMPLPQEGEGANLRIPEGVSQIVFEKGSVRAQDAAGNDVVVQPHWEGQVWTTALSAPGQQEGLLFEGQSGEMVLRLPEGTRSVMIFPNQTTMDGSIVAVDGQGNVLGGHYNSDIQLLPLEADPFQFARIEPFMTAGQDGSVGLDLPAGTRSVLVNGAQAGNDGSLVALDGYGRALALHPNWGGHWSTEGQSLTADPGASRYLSGSEEESLSLTIVPGTRRVEIRPGAEGATLRQLDGSGRVLAEQEGISLKVVQGGI